MKPAIHSLFNLWKTRIGERQANDVLFRLMAEYSEGTRLEELSGKLEHERNILFKTAKR